MADALSLKRIDEWSREDAQQAVARDLPATYNVARLIIEEDNYWQNGKLWPAHRGQSTALDLENLRRIEPGVVPDPLLKEIVRNRGDGLLQREATVTFVPVNAEDDTDLARVQETRVASMLAAITRWWDNKRFWKHARTAFNRTAYGRRAGLRLAVAPGNLRTPNPTVIERLRRSVGLTAVDLVPRLPTGQDLADALDIIEVSAPDPKAAHLYTIPATQRKAAVILDKVVVEGREEDRAEIWLSERLPNGKARTRLIQITDSGRLEFPVDLGGRLPFAEMETDEIITDPVIKNQSLLTFDNTVLGRVIEAAGFPQVFLGNVEPPGIWLDYPPEPESSALDKIVEAKKTFWKHRVPWQFGFSAVSEIVGIKNLERQGVGAQQVTREGFETPSVTIKEPTDPDYVIKAKDDIRATIYKQCSQGHFSNTSTAEASGLAYQQARSQFEAYLVGVKSELERLIRETIEAAIAYAALMSPEAVGFLDDFRCSVTMHVTAGPITAADAQMAVALRDGRLISTTTAQQRVGIEDPAAEQRLILDDPFIQLQLQTARANLMNTLISGGETTNDVAAHIAGFSPEEVAAIRTSTPPTAPTPPSGNGRAAQPQVTTPRLGGAA